EKIEKNNSGRAILKISRTTAVNFEGLKGVTCRIKRPLAIWIGCRKLWLIREVRIVVYDFKQRPGVTVVEGCFDIATLAQPNASFLPWLAIRRRVDRHHKEPISLVAHHLYEVQWLSDSDVEAKPAGTGVHSL